MAKKKATCSHGPLLVSKYQEEVPQAVCRKHRRRLLQRLYDRTSDLEARSQHVEVACQNLVGQGKWMMMMNWCPLSRGYEKTKVERLRGELLSLTDFGVEGTLEEREAKVEQVFNMLWKENLQLRSLPACHPSSFYPPSCWASTLIITNVPSFHRSKGGEILELKNKLKMFEQKVPVTLDWSLKPVTLEGSL